MDSIVVSFAASSTAEDYQVELAEMHGVGEQGDCDDLPALDREVEYASLPLLRENHRGGGG